MMNGSVIANLIVGPMNHSFTIDSNSGGSQAGQLALYR